MFAVSLAGSGRCRLRRAVCALLITTVTVVGAACGSHVPSRATASSLPAPVVAAGAPFDDAGYWAIADSLQARLDPLWNERAGPLPRRRRRLRDDDQRARAAHAQRRRAHRLHRALAQRRTRAADRAGARDRAGVRHAQPAAHTGRHGAARARLEQLDDRRRGRRARGVRRRDRRRARGGLASAPRAAAAGVHRASDRRAHPQRRELALLALAGAAPATSSTGSR